jgi:predicted dehydrogenase
MNCKFKFGLAVVKINGRKLRFAVIGLGKMGLLHASLLNFFPQSELVALCEKSALMNRFLKKMFANSGVHVVDDLEKLRGLELDAVCVTTPITSHSYVIKEVYAKDIARNVFVEKTLALNHIQSKELCKLAKNFGGVTMVGYMKRFSVTFGKAKNILNERVLGEISSVDAYAYSSDFSKIESRSKKSATRGGVLSDLGSHVIDLALWFFGDFEVESASSKSILCEEGEDSVDFNFKKLGMEGKAHISWCMDAYRMPNFGLCITGSAGTMKVNDYGLNLKLLNGDSHEWFRHDLDDYVNFFLGDSEYCREDEAFINSILNGDKIEPSFVTAAKVDAVIDQVKEKAKADGN